MRTKGPAICLIALLAASGLGCIKHEGQVAIFLTRNTDDAAAGGQVALGVRQVNLAVSAVEVMSPDERAFVTLARGLQTYELVGMQDRPGLLALASALRDGNYSEIRLTFSASDSYVVDERGRQQSLKVDPVEVSVPALFRVIEDAEAEVLLELDLDASLAQKGNGEWILRPVIRQGTTNGSLFQ